MFGGQNFFNFLTGKKQKKKKKSLKNFCPTGWTNFDQAPGQPADQLKKVLLEHKKISSERIFF